MCPIAWPSWNLAVMFCSWTTRRRTLAGWLMITTRQCCTAVEFQPQFPRSLSLGLFFLERAQDTDRSASNSCRSRRLADTFFCPACITERGQAAVGCSRTWARVCRPKACVAARGVFSSSTGTADHIVPFKDTAHNPP